MGGMSREFVQKFVYRYGYFINPAKSNTLHPLTKIFHRGKMAPHAGMVELGSDASAACGGCSELSAWPRSARDEGASAEDIRRAPQQEDSVDFGSTSRKKLNMRAWWNW